jgi:hypothetical protein
MELFHAPYLAKTWNHNDVTKIYVFVFNNIIIIKYIILFILSIEF